MSITKRNQLIRMNEFSGICQFSSTNNLRWTVKIKLPDSEDRADSVPEVHEFIGGKGDRALLLSVDAEKVAKPIAVNHAVQEMSAQL